MVLVDLPLRSHKSLPRTASAVVVRCTRVFFPLCQVAVDALSAIDRMECTVNDVLDFRKLDANLFKMCNKEVDVSAVVSRICHHCRSFLLPTVGLQYRVVPGEARACIDARRLHQIVVNGLRCVVMGCSCSGLGGLEGAA